MTPNATLTIEGGSPLRITARETEHDSIEIHRDSIEAVLNAWNDGADKFAKVAGASVSWPRDDMAVLAWYDRGLNAAEALVIEEDSGSPHYDVASDGLGPVSWSIKLDAIPDQHDDVFEAEVTGFALPVVVRCKHLGTTINYTATGIHGHIKRDWIDASTVVRYTREGVTA